MAEERTPLNAPGPFYVAKDQCITCMAPEAEAPSLMAFDEERSSCYFRRQPESPDETYRAMRACWVSCCGAVRYGGSDPDVIARLANIGLASQIDLPVKEPVHRVVRDRATFEYDATASPKELAADLGAELVAAFPHGTVSETVGGDEWASFVWSWAESIPGARMALEVRRLAGVGDQWMVRLTEPEHVAAPSIGTSVDDALRATGRAQNLRWHTLAEWESERREGSPLPI